MADINDISKYIDDTENLINKGEIDIQNVKDIIESSNNSIKDFWDTKINEVGGYSYTDYDDARNFLTNYYDDQDREQQLDDVVSGKTTDDKTKKAKTYDLRKGFVVADKEATKKHEDTREALISKLRSLNDMQLSLINKNEDIINELQLEISNLEKKEANIDQKIEETEQEIQDLKIQNEALSVLDPISEEDKETIENNNIRIGSLDTILQTLKDDKTGFDLEEKRKNLTLFKDKNKELKEKLNEYFKFFKEEFDMEDYPIEKVETYSNTPRANDTNRSEYQNNERRNNGEYKLKSDLNDDTGKEKKPDFEYKPKQSVNQNQSVPSNNSSGVVSGLQGQSFEPINQGLEETSMIEADPIEKARSVIKNYLQLSSSDRRATLYTDGYPEIMEALNTPSLKLDSSDKKALKEAIKQDKYGILNETNIQKDEVIDAFNAVGITVTDDDYKQIYGDGRKGPNLISNLRKLDEKNINLLDNAMNNFYDKVGKGELSETDINKFNNYVGNVLKHAQLENNAKDHISRFNFKFLNKSNNKDLSINNLSETISKGETNIQNKVQSNNDLRSEVAKYVNKTPPVKYFNERTSIRAKDIGTR